MTRCLVVNSPMVINIIYKALTVFMDVGARLCDVLLHAVFCSRTTLSGTS